MNRPDMEKYQDMSKDELLEELRIELTSNRYDARQIHDCKSSNDNLTKKNNDLSITLKTILKTINT